MCSFFFYHLLISYPFFGLLEQLICDFVKKENIPLEAVKTTGILVGRDTRPSGESLLEAAKEVWFPLNNHVLWSSTAGSNACIHS